jgi:hypothetical protein
LVLTNEENMIDRGTIVHDLPFGKSDHCTLNFKYNCYYEDAQSNTPRLKYYKGDYDSMRVALENENWETVL